MNKANFRPAGAVLLLCVSMAFSGQAHSASNDAITDWGLSSLVTAGKLTGGMVGVLALAYRQTQADERPPASNVQVLTSTMVGIICSSASAGAATRWKVAGVGDPATRNALAEIYGKAAVDPVVGFLCGAMTYAAFDSFNYRAPKVEAEIDCAEDIFKTRLGRGQFNSALEKSRLATRQVNSRIRNIRHQLQHVYNVSEEVVRISNAVTNSCRVQSRNCEYEKGRLATSERRYDAAVNTVVAEARDANYHMDVFNGQIKYLHRNSSCPANESYVRKHL